MLISDALAMAFSFGLLRQRPYREATSSQAKENSLSKTESANTQQYNPLPDYIIEYAPLVHLHSQERYWPSRVATHLENSYIMRNLSYIKSAPDPLLPSNIDFLNRPDIYLTSKQDPTQDPDWITSKYGKPDPNTHRSDAPAVIVAVDKSSTLGNGTVDAFYFYFYSFNLGNSVLGRRYGNHVGDWENSLVRFQHGKPTHVYVSEHAFGSAYTYDCLEHNGKRPLLFSGIGTHAMYVTPRSHHYTKLGPLLGDHTDRGPLWDIVLNYKAYWYSLQDGFQATSKSDEPVNWLDFLGKWGDKRYPPEDQRQYHFFGEWAWTSGPTGNRSFQNCEINYIISNTIPGPIAKNLLRDDICETLSGEDCLILTDKDDIYIEKVDDISME